MKLKSRKEIKAVLNKAKWNIEYLEKIIDGHYDEILAFGNDDIIQLQEVRESIQEMYYNLK